MTRPLDSLAKRLKFARLQRGITQAKLASLSGVEQPDVSKIELGKIQKTTGIARLARALQVPTDWLEEGRGPEPNWSNSHSANERVAAYTVAHAADQARPMIDPTTIAWEAILDHELPPRFTLLIRDDAMVSNDSGSLAPGDRAVFETARPPKAGRNVLLSDQAGNVYIREYQVRTPDHWIAHARNPAYQPLDSKVDGLVVLATQVGHLY